MPSLRLRPYTSTPKLSIQELRSRRAAHAIASMEARVSKAQQALERIEQAIEVLKDQIRAVQGRPQSTTRVGQIRQQQASFANAYTARYLELQREVDLARKHLATESRILCDLKQRLQAAGHCKTEA